MDHVFEYYRTFCDESGTHYSDFYGPFDSYITAYQAALDAHVELKGWIKAYVCTNVICDGECICTIR